MTSQTFSAGRGERGIILNILPQALQRESQDPLPGMEKEIQNRKGGEFGGSGKGRAKNNCHAEEIPGSALHGSGCGTVLSLCESKRHSWSWDVSSSAIVVRLSPRSAAPGRDEVNEVCAKYVGKQVDLRKYTEDF